MAASKTLTPEQRSLRARIGANAMHASHDTRVVSSHGRAAFLARFEREVDPDGVLELAERQRRAQHARRAYFQNLALKSSKARTRRRGAG